MEQMAAMKAALEGGKRYYVGGENHFGASFWFGMSQDGYHHSPSTAFLFRIGMDWTFLWRPRKTKQKAVRELYERPSKWFAFCPRKTRQSSTYCILLHYTGCGKHISGNISCFGSVKGLERRACQDKRIPAESAIFQFLCGYKGKKARCRRIFCLDTTSTLMKLPAWASTLCKKTHILQQVASPVTLSTHSSLCLKHGFWRLQVMVSPTWERWLASQWLMATWDDSERFHDSYLTKS